jgi:hypothetical protein
VKEAQRLWEENETLKEEVNYSNTFCIHWQLSLLDC